MRQDILIERLTQGWAGDVDALLSVYDEECRFEDKALDLVHHGHDGVREVFAFSFKIMPDFCVKYGRCVICEDGGAIEWVFTGSFRGDFDGNSYNGKPVRIEGVSYMTFKGDRIKTNTDYWNARSLLEQLGR